MKVVNHARVHFGELLLLCAWPILLAVIQSIFDFGSWILIVATLSGLMWGGLWFAWMMNRYVR